MNISWGLVTTTFLASVVEAIEMVTIVLGVGLTRGWRSTLTGTVIGFVVLAVLSFGLGTGLAAIPIDVLRIVIGALLLIFGLQWLRKAIPKVAAHGFQGEGEEEEGTTEAGEVTGLIDWTAFVLAFKGVVLEGLEIAFIVVSFAAAAGGQYIPAAASAVGAVVVVGGIGAVFQEQLGRIPRRVLQIVVGGMLATFGTFWAVEGLGIEWPGADLAVVGLLVLYAAVIGTLLVLSRRRRLGLAPEGGAA